MNDYFIWITAMLPDYEADILAGLINKGYMIRPAIEDNKITRQSKSYNGAVLIAIMTTNAASAQKLHDDTSNVLDQVGVLYYSLIITPVDMDSKYSITNIKLPELIQPSAPIEP